jgi:hypothetical protein
MEVNDLFNSHSECNLIFVTLVDEIGLETYEHQQPCSLSWLKKNFIVIIKRHCKVMFSINFNFIDYIECVPHDACDV